MPTVDLVVSTAVSETTRARQVEALFDVPRQEKATLHWSGEVPIEERDWLVGLIVGPSGSGKTSIARHVFGDAYHPTLRWGKASVLDDCNKSLTVEQIGAAFSSVGFGTIPAWLRPYAVLSNGEKFRADVARRMLELDSPIVVDEFTSVVDRQVAKVGSHAVQKYVRKTGKKFVAVTCHYDVEDWLQPDWVLDASTMEFRWRLLRRRPELELVIQQVEYRAWQLFAPFHYMSADLNKSAKCFCGFVDDRPVCFGGVLHLPHARAKNVKRLSRLVTLPDWQGVGLSFVLTDALASAYKAIGMRYRTYPAHPALVRSFGKSPLWAMVKAPGTFHASHRASATATIAMGTSRPCAVFEYIGEAMKDKDAAKNLVA